MSKYRELFLNNYPSNEYVETRPRGDIPGILVAKDVFVVDGDGHITIKNPSEPYHGNKYIN